MSALEKQPFGGQARRTHRTALPPDSSASSVFCITASLCPSGVSRPNGLFWGHPGSTELRWFCRRVTGSCSPSRQWLPLLHMYFPPSGSCPPCPDSYLNPKAKGFISRDCAACW